MKEIGSYSKIYSLGHRAVRNIFASPTLIQEKVDGSQISFTKRGGVLYIRSKKVMLYIEEPERMFSLGIIQINERKDSLKDGWIYRGEYLRKPKHNVLKYDRVPEGHTILFDVQIGDQEFLGPERMQNEAHRLGFEVVPYWYVTDPSRGDLGEMLLRPSVLGGTAVEGVVIKNYSMFDSNTGKVLMAKYVSEAFKEVHQRKQYKQGHGDVITKLIERYSTVARWQKAVQHLREEGKLDDSPKDIGSLIKEVNIDVHDEHADEIKEALFKWGWKKIARGITKGLPEWYKEKLLNKQFEED